jgi:DNA-binding NarL/FixJ family response regulator
MIKVGICDDDQLIRAGLRLIIDQEPDLEVVAEAGTGAEAIDVVSAHSIDVMLMDIRMPEMDGIDATRHIVATADGPRVIILTTFELDEYVFAALSAGASGFLLKRTPPDQLIEGIRVVAGGEALLAPSVTRRLIEAFTRQAPVRADPTQGGRLTGLTPRELEVLAGIGRGLSNRELAEELFIADNTVKTHVKRVFIKIGARDRAQAVVIAYQTGLV